MGNRFVKLAAVISGLCVLSPVAVYLMSRTTMTIILILGGNKEAQGIVGGATIVFLVIAALVFIVISLSEMTMSGRWPWEDPK